MQLVTLAILINICQAGEKYDVSFINFQMETFFPVTRLDLEKSSRAVPRKIFAEVKSVIDRFKKDTVKPKLSEGRIRLIFKSNGIRYVVDADGSIDVNGQGGKIPLDNLLHLNRLLLKSLKN